MAHLSRKIGKYCTNFAETRCRRTWAAFPDFAYTFFNSFPGLTKYDRAFFGLNIFCFKIFFAPHFFLTKTVIWREYLCYLNLFSQKSFFELNFWAQKYSRKMRLKILDIKFFNLLNQNALENGVWLWRWPNLISFIFPD